MPDTYSITDALGHTVVDVHHSRVVRFTGRDLPYLERVAEMYWGESEIEALYKDVVAHDNVSANMAALDLPGEHQHHGSARASEQLFSSVASPVERSGGSGTSCRRRACCGRTSGCRLSSRATRSPIQQYTFTGLQDVYETMCLNLCGASHYPMTQLFGRSPGGHERHRARATCATTMTMWTASARGKAAPGLCRSCCPCWR